MRQNGTIRSSGGPQSLVLAACCLALAAGCTQTPPTKTVETPNLPEAAPNRDESRYIAAPGAAPRSVAAAGPSARPIYDYDVAPAEYSIRPLAQWTEQEAAADALGRIGSPAVPQLIEALGSPRPNRGCRRSRCWLGWAQTPKKRCPISFDCWTIQTRGSAKLPRGRLAELGRMQPRPFPR